VVGLTADQQVSVPTLTGEWLRLTFLHWPVPPDPLLPRLRGLIGAPYRSGRLSAVQEDSWSATPASGSAAGTCTGCSSAPDRSAGHRHRWRSG